MISEKVRWKPETKRLGFHFSSKGEQIWKPPRFIGAGFQIILFLLISGISHASLTGIHQRIDKLTLNYEGKVGVAFIDLKTGWQMNINGSREFPAASVAKVPVMATAYHLSESGKLNLEQKVLFKENDKVGGAGILQWIKAGRLYTLWNLIRLMIVLSDNTATKILVDTIGMPTINESCRSVGLNQTTIYDPTMLIEPPSPEVNLTTPLDMAQLLVMIKKQQGFSPNSSREMLRFMKIQHYRWGIWRGVPPGIVVANKTGNLERVLNDVGIVYTKKGNYVLSIFTWGFKKQREARLLINEISKAAYEEYTGEKVIQPKRKLRRRPSVKSPRRSGHRGGASGRKSHISPRR